MATVEVRPGKAKRARRSSRRAGDYDELDAELSFLPRNDIGNAHRLMQRVASNDDDGLLYVRGLGWAGWDRRRWSVDDGAHRAVRTAQTTVEAMRREVAAFAGRDGVTPDDIDQYSRFAVSSGNSARVRAMIDQAEPHLAWNAGDIDQDRYLLNVENGTLRLRAHSGLVLAPHAQGDRLTKLAPVRYLPEALCPAWDAFLAEIQPDPAMRAFLQRWFGYCLTGDVSAECLCIFWGAGANGKGVMTETMQMVAGDYGQTMPVASLMQDDRRRGSEASPDIARLPGARMVFANEPENNMAFSEGLVKTLTGGDVITARKLNHDFFQFAPQFHITISTNPKPAIKGLDDGIWRRIHLVPFDVQIPLEHRVPKSDLLARFRDELPGILNWLLAGLRDWLNGGLRPPDKVVQATQEYREDSNPLGQFLRQCTERIDGVIIGAAELNDAFTRWCVLQGVKPWSATAVGRKMSDMGFHRSKVGTISYIGLRLHEEWKPKPKPAPGEPPPPEPGDPGPMPSL